MISYLLYNPKIFEGEKFQGFLSGLKNFTLKHFGLSRCLLYLFMVPGLNTTISD